MPPGATPHLGRPLRSFDSLDSTNDELWRWASEGATHGACVRAASQTAGRGRQGRHWHSPPGAGLYFSVLFRPSGLQPSWNSFALAVGGAMVRALEQQFDLPVRLKWPNDLIVGREKLGGILCETRDVAGAALVAGVGINLAAPLDGWPDELRRTATSVAEKSSSADLREEQVDELFVGCLARLERAYHLYSARGLQPFLDELRERDAIAGHRVRFLGPGGEPEEGRAAGIEADGGLRVDVGGRQRTLYAGEVHLMAEQD